VNGLRDISDQTEILVVLSVEYPRPSLGVLPDNFRRVVRGIIIDDVADALWMVPLDLRSNIPKDFIQNRRAIERWDGYREFRWHKFLTIIRSVKTHGSDFLK
jgi:hypothetical protein